MSRETFQKGCIVTVGEAWGADVERARLYTAPDGSGLNMIFQFEPMALDTKESKWDARPLSLPELKKCYARWQNGLYGEGWNSLFLENHDVPRIVSRWGDDKKYHTESAKMLAAMLFGMQGTPFIYQGEELGMTNIRLTVEEYNDVEIKNAYAELTAKGRSHNEIMESIYAQGRDNARTPMQWDASPNAGFTDGDPWLPVNENYVSINAENEVSDPNSVFSFYRKLITLRKKYPVFEQGTFMLLEPDDEQLFVYRRDTEYERLLVVCNFSGSTVGYDVPGDFSGADVLIANYGPGDEKLRPYEAFMLYKSDVE